MRTLPVPQPMSVKQLMRKKCIAPKIFQRRSVWDKADKTPYIQSVNKGDALSTIVLANIAECMEFCKGDYPQCYGRFKTLYDAGHRYIILDGQNRINCLESFYNNEYGIHGDFYDKDGLLHTLKNVTRLSEIKVKFPRLHDSFSDASVLVLELTDRNWVELHELFKGINSGRPLNRMEIRNSKTTFASEYFRDLAESSAFRDMLAAVHGFAASKINRMVDVEVALKAYIMTSNLKNKESDYLLRNSYLNDKTLDIFYDRGVPFRPQQDVEEYSQSALDRFEIIIDHWSKITTSIKSSKSNPTPQKMMWASLFLTEYLYDRNMLNGIEDYSSMANDFRELVRDIEDKSYEDYTKEARKFKAKQAKLLSSIEKASSDVDRLLLEQQLEELNEPMRSHYFFFKISDLKKVYSRNSVREDIYKKLPSINFRSYNSTDQTDVIEDEVSEDFALASK